MLKQNSSFILGLLALVDLLVLLASFYISNFIVTRNIFTFSFKETIIILILVFVFFIALERSEFSHTYRFKPFRVILKNIFRLLIYMISSFYLLILFDIFKFENKFVLCYITLVLSFVFIERMFIKLALTILRKKGFNFRNYLIVGAGQVGLNFYRKVVSSNELGIRIVGFLDDNEEFLNADDPEYTDAIKGLLLGKTDKIETILKTMALDNVVLALPMYAEQKIVNITNLCEKYGVKAELIPDYFKIITANPSIRQIKGYPLIGIRNIPLENMYNRFVKRLCDIILSGAALIVLSPLFLIITIGIKLTSKGPVFFKQKRTGFKQKDFEIIKFRTMLINDEADTKQATKDDPRKTKFGDFLRKYNLDELPQIINILKGEMSIVGPRPHMLAHTEEFYQKYDKYLVRHWVKPGLTGWAQVNGWRGDSDIGIRVRYDIEYIENWSLFFDLKIVFLTAFGKQVKKYAY
ncbi:MAG TPA: undecaprenyl-phosphate glucose phosphotransferase [Spirochaetota bacterium]|nr:undecaprenyl-phosphate glucose phosphotransferase [Spirochaetota bacterium]HOS32431.1 undecaprenyl-phosphate glucose phosphotransferase [Spirochaetota bacterium]HOS55826.1 undecaprenyl-phosphate glucose phosphotransferase [Spirochaetota bacterium]HPK62663.1 undecaprenyl-phosphate glucose phosphotransferase [Spirochaetota bacterium]HQF77928.1 undecaprenyl-phosphate glucose phosphotransferase [Spirochaetota bacterium]